MGEWLIITIITIIINHPIPYQAQVSFYDLLGLWLVGIYGRMAISGFVNSVNTIVISSVNPKSTKSCASTYLGIRPPVVWPPSFGFNRLLCACWCLGLSKNGGVSHHSDGTSNIVMAVISKRGSFKSESTGTSSKGLGTCGTGVGIWKSA